MTRRLGVIVRLANNLIDDGDGSHYVYSVVSKDERKLELKLRCDKDGEEDEYPTFTDVDDLAVVTVKATVKHKRACPVFSIADFYENNKVTFTIGFIIAGLFVAFLGRKLFKVALFLLGALAITTVLFLIFYQTWLIKSEDKSKGNRNTWIALGISGGIGIVVGVFLIIYERLCFFAVGGVLGGLGGFILYAAIIGQFTDPVFLLD